MSQIPIVRSREALRRQVAGWKAAGARVALVPTMGALHAGHLSLVGLGRQHADKVVASLFVNPTQFAPSEDFDAYPRDEARDAALLAQAGCHLLYAPAPAEIYPPGFATAVTVSGLTDSMEGALRPSHFGGVATVVTKLLVQAQPDAAVFGEKDFQQLQVIRRLTADLDLPVQIVPGPIVRDPDGLAMSSRNAYLDPGQRAAAPALFQALTAAANDLAAGARVDTVRRRGCAAILGAGFDSVDYLDVRRADTLEAVDAGPLAGPARLLTVARLGKTRLLDNLAVEGPSR